MIPTDAVYGHHIVEVRMCLRIDRLLMLSFVWLMPTDEAYVYQISQGVFENRSVVDLYDNHSTFTLA